MKNYERRLVKTLAANPHPAAYASIQETSGSAPVKEEVWVVSSSKVNLQQYSSSLVSPHHPRVLLRHHRRDLVLRKPTVWKLD